MISELHAMELKQNMILSPGTTGELGQAGISQFSNCWDGDPAVQAITDGTDVVGGGSGFLQGLCSASPPGKGSRFPHVPL